MQRLSVTPRSGGNAPPGIFGLYSGAESPEFPRIAGQYNDYLVKALQRYKSGERKNPIMAPLAANLSRRDIEDLAAYYSQQKGLYTQY